jgi:hypothetical protein
VQHRFKDHQDPNKVLHIQDMTKFLLDWWIYLSILHQSSCHWCPCHSSKWRSIERHPGLQEVFS